jgi:transcriptional regulator with XRE-family HTH domain
MSANETFGQRLRKLRKEKGLTQEALAERIGAGGHYLSRVQIARLETDMHQPSWETVQNIAAALGVDCTAFQGATVAETVKPSGKGEAPGTKAGKPKKKGSV